MAKSLPKGLSVIEHNGLLLAKLYDTIIVSLDKKAKVLTLNSGGWKTKHTKKCINLVLEDYFISVYQKQFEWFIHFSTETIPFNDNVPIDLNLIAKSVPSEH